MAYLYYYEQSFIRVCISRLNYYTVTFVIRSFFFVILLDYWFVFSTLSIYTVERSEGINVIEIGKVPRTTLLGNRVIRLGDPLIISNRVLTR